MDRAELAAAGRALWPGSQRQATLEERTKTAVIPPISAILGRQRPLSCHPILPAFDRRAVRFADYHPLAHRRCYRGRTAKHPSTEVPPAESAAFPCRRCPSAYSVACTPTSTRTRKPSLKPAERTARKKRCPTTPDAPSLQQAKAGTGRLPLPLPASRSRPPERVPCRRARPLTRPRTQLRPLASADCAGAVYAVEAGAAAWARCRSASALSDPTVQVSTG